MTLAAKFQARYSAARVLQLTNPDDPASTNSVDSDRLTAAAEDAEEEFKALAGVAYDDDNRRHVAAAVLGVEWRLLTYSGNGQGKVVQKAFDLFEAACLRLAKTGGGLDRILPDTDSVLLPTEQSADSRPDFDRRNWGDVVLGMPGGTDDEDEATS